MLKANKTKIYFLPGTMCNYKLWSYINKYFDDTYELVFLEIPNVAGFEKMSEALLPQFKEKKINLIGFSLGAYLASFFANKYKHRINRLFLISASPTLLPEIEIAQRQKALQVISHETFRALSRKKIKSLLEIKNQTNEEIISLIQEMYVDLGFEVLKNQLLSTLKRIDMSENISSFSFPVSFLYSLNDDLINKSWINKLKSKNSTFSFIEIDSRSHMIPLEKEEILSNEIKKFLSL